MDRMTRTLAIVAALLLTQLAACAGGGTYASSGVMSHDSVARGYADAIQEGIERARAMQQFERLPASADRPG
jgi:hypothetical protein